jgi:DNA-binding response OmpR family regulator
VLDFSATPKRTMEPLRPTSVVRFGTYEVSLQSGEVRKAGLRIRVQQQPMKLLEILLERPGKVVTREELRSRVWTDESFGDFDQAVNIAIAKLRSALGTRPRIRVSSRLFQSVAIASLRTCRSWMQTPGPKGRNLRMEI